MKKTLNFFLILILHFFSVSIYCQEILGQKDISNWLMLSTDEEQPHFKSIGDNNFIALYITSMQSGGITIFDNNLNIINDCKISLKGKRYLIDKPGPKGKFVEFPKFFFRKNDSSIVILGQEKLSSNTYSILGLNFNIKTGELFRIDSLQTLKSAERISVSLSKNEEYILIDELFNLDWSNNIHKCEVYNQNCEKLYTIKIDLPASSDCQSYITDNGELIQSYIIYSDKKYNYKFSKFNNKGELVGSIFYAPIEKSLKKYEYRFIQLSRDSIYVVLNYKRQEFDGIKILNLDFAKQSYEIKLDKLFNEQTINIFYKNADPKHTMTGENKLSPLRENDIDNLVISNIFIDKNSFYILFETYFIGSDNMNQPHFTNQDAINMNQPHFTNQDAILCKFESSGSLIWGIPIVRDIKTMAASSGRGFTSNGLGAKIKVYLDENYIYMIVPSQKQVFVTRIDKMTSKDCKPIPVIKDTDYYTNFDTMLWLSGDNAIITSMKGIYFVLSESILMLYSVKFNY